LAPRRRSRSSSARCATTLAGRYRAGRQGSPFVLVPFLDSTALPYREGSCSPRGVHFSRQVRRTWPPAPSVAGPWSGPDDGCPTLVPCRGAGRRVQGVIAVRAVRSHPSAGLVYRRILGRPHPRRWPSTAAPRRRRSMGPIYHTRAEATSFHGSQELGSKALLPDRAKPGSFWCVCDPNNFGGKTCS